LIDAAGNEKSSHRMRILKYGYFGCRIAGIATGQNYAMRLDGKTPRPDPASRWQPNGVHGPSAIWRAADFLWTDHDWRGIALSKLAIYELHVGTFTPQGTFAAIIPRLEELKSLGVTAIELMPVGQFPGERGWGYDGVYWFAVQQSYGGPTEMQRFVDACHACGLAVILDVVYNHFGPEGNYLGEYGPIFSTRHHTPWGAAINFDGAGCQAVRDLVTDNVRHWIRDFHIDGLRLDAVHAVFDDSPTHLLCEIKRVAEAEANRFGRPVHVIAESNLNDVQLLDAPADGGLGLDAQWNDDFHHCIHALLTGERDGYYADYDAPAQQLVKALNEVFVYDGAFSQFWGRNHGRQIGQHTGDRFVVSIQTHDQVGNRPHGDRLGTLLDPPRQRIAAGLLLLSPHIPLLFMGEEYGETTPFPFFCDFGDEALRQSVRSGRREEFAAFRADGELPDATACATFGSAILSWSWPVGSIRAGLRTLYRDLLSLRQSHPALRDFQHRTAQLLSNNSSADILLLTRGDLLKDSRSLWAVFNLSAQQVRLPALTEISIHPLMYSEERRFGGEIDCRGELDVLLPFSFSVLSN
jgi:maltooligosyltrehalose trehalohydrolase